MNQEVDLETPLLVTTSYRGVFFGYANMPESIPNEITLKRARMCIYWPDKVKGVFGLAAAGPLEGSRIGPKVESLLLNAITAIARVSSEAATRWEAAPWQ